MKIHPQITMKRLEEAITGSESMGFCVSCGEEAYGVEPDARNYECESCGEKQVYGAEEILMMVAI